MVQTGTVIVIQLHFAKRIMLCTQFLPPCLLFLPRTSDALKATMALRIGARPLPVCLTTE